MLAIKNPSLTKFVGLADKKGLKTGGMLNMLKMLKFWRSKGQNGPQHTQNFYHFYISLVFNTFLQKCKKKTGEMLRMLNCLGVDPHPHTKKMFETGEMFKKKQQMLKFHFQKNAYNRGNVKMLKMLNCLGESPLFSGVGGVGGVNFPRTIQHF